MECETERLVGVLGTFAVVEEVLLEIVHDREQGATSCVSRGVLAIGASNTPGQGRFEEKCLDVSIYEDEANDGYRWRPGRRRDRERQREL